jgi:3-oxoacyl-[acyl-carrier protein] reductase
MKSNRILVTGASKGIGKGIALELASAGYDIIVHYNSDQAGAKDTIAQIEAMGQKAWLMQFDVGNREQVNAAIDSDYDSNGAVYGIVCNAGITRDGIFPTMSDDDWDSVINTNLSGFYNVVKPNIMNLITARAPGRIVVMSSVSGIIGNRGQVNYSAAKAGLIGATKALATEVARKKITVNCVAPGIIDTGMVTEEVFKHAKAMIPMQRMGTVKEVAGIVKFLMSDDAAYITRQVISVNGGMC